MPLIGNSTTNITGKKNNKETQTHKSISEIIQVKSHINASQLKLYIQPG